MASEAAAQLADLVTPSQLSPHASANVLFFDQFYRVNTHKIIMPQKTVPAVDVEAIRRQADYFRQFEDSQVAADFGDLLAREIRRVSFNEFYSELHSCAMKVREHCMRTNTQLVVYMSDAHKSYLWTTLLVWPVVRAFVVDVMLSSSLVPQIQPGPWMILMVDDAAYSGSQAATIIKHISYRYEEYSPDALYVLIPFMSTRARKRMLKASRTKLILGFSSIMDNIGDFYPLGVPKSLRESQDVSANQCMTYFDHKFADYVSLPLHWMKNDAAQTDGFYRSFRYTLPSPIPDSNITQAFTDNIWVQRF
jgi:hypothetical protein